MDIQKILGELRRELEHIDEVICSLERLAGTRREPDERVGRPAFRIRRQSRPYPLGGNDRVLKMSENGHG